MGFLDLFDSPDVLRTLLGGGDQSGAAAGGPPPAPPMAEPPKDQGRVISAPYPPPMAYSNEDPVDFPGRFQGIVAGQGPQPGPGGAPMPPPRPPGSPGAVDALADGGGMGGGRPALGAQRLPMPPMAAGGGQPVMGGAQEAGGLMQALGLQDPQKRRAVFSALASGLQNVGKGHGGMAAFAGGAGAALGGARTSGDQDDDRAMKVDAHQLQREQFQNAKANQSFMQTSTAFKDMIAAKQAENQEAYRKAQAAYLNARADNMKAGGTGSNAWQGTEYGRLHLAETEAQKYHDAQLRGLNLRKDFMSDEDKKAALDDLDKRTEKFRLQRYRMYNVDPNRAEKLKNMGISQDNPFDTKGMTLDQFNATVPLGAWFLDGKGEPRRRTKPPPGMAAPASPQDDEAAMKDPE